MHPEVTVHLTPADLATRWSVSVGHLANLRSMEAGPIYLKLGGRIRYRLVDVEAFERQTLVLGASA